MAHELLKSFNMVSHKKCDLQTNMGYMTDHASPRRYECNPVFYIGTRGICKLVLKLHNPMKNCGTR